MTNSEIIQKAIDLTYKHEARYHSRLDEVNWIEENGCSMDYDYCNDCIDKALHEKRKEYSLNQRKLPIDKRDQKFSQFAKTYNYGGGYEDSYFACCASCGQPLEICILPNKETIEEVLEELEDGKIDDELGWKCHWLLYNAWGDERHKECNEPTLRLAEKVIGILELTQKTKLEVPTRVH